MLYNRAEFVDLCEQFAPENVALFVSLIWHLSKCDPNCVDNFGRIGLLQVPHVLAREFGIENELELLEPRLNVATAAKIINRHGLLLYLGREFSSQVHSILGLERFLRENTRKASGEREQSFLSQTKTF